MARAALALAALAACAACATATVELTAKDFDQQVRAPTLLRARREEGRLTRAGERNH